MGIVSGSNNLSRALRFGDLPISLEYLSHEIVQIISIDVFGGLKP